MNHIKNALRGQLTNKQLGDLLRFELELEILFGIYTIQHNTSDTEHMLIMNARTPVITKIVDATGRPLKL